MGTFSSSHNITLIELLIVVAIIAILAAIAVPNFLEAQTRSKVSRVMSDLRTLSLAAEAYFTDHNAYPPNSNGPIGGPHPGSTVLFIVPLSTPIGYVTEALYEDPFGNSEFELTQVGEKSIYFYINTSRNDPLAFPIVNAAFPASQQAKRDLAFDWRYYIASAGPDRIFEVQLYQIAGFPNGYVPDIQARVNATRGVYDPTNGTISLGDIHRTHKGFMTGRYGGL